MFFSCRFSSKFKYGIYFLDLFGLFVSCSFGFDLFVKMFVCYFWVSGVFLEVLVFSKRFRVTFI